MPDDLASGARAVALGREPHAVIPVDRISHRPPPRPPLAAYPAAPPRWLLEAWSRWLQVRAFRVALRGVGLGLVLSSAWPLAPGACVPLTLVAALLLFGSAMALGSGAFAAANWAMTADVVPHDRAARSMGIANVGTGAAAAARSFSERLSAGSASCRRQCLS